MAIFILLSFCLCLWISPVGAADKKATTPDALTESPELKVMDLEYKLFQVLAENARLRAQLLMRELQERQKQQKKPNKKK